ncbi:MAG: hypothetical protein ACD_58C00117G0001 [uncultured bacterium]|nr:MAG: hypothetical protein ACD_58C00117G0001 [uncultured bacterium]
MKKVLFLLSFILVLFATDKCLAQSVLQVSPSIVDQTISQNQDYKFELTVFNSNLNLSKYTFSVSPGLNSEFDLSNYISFNKSDINIEPNSSDSIEVYVQSAKLDSGKTYNSLINISQNDSHYQLAVPIIITVAGDNKVDSGLINISSNSHNQLSGFSYNIKLNNNTQTKQDFKVKNEFTDRFGNILAETTKRRTVLPKQTTDFVNNLKIDNGFLFFPKKLIANTTITDKIGNEKKLQKSIIYFNFASLSILFLITVFFIILVIIYINNNKRKALISASLYFIIMISLYAVSNYFSNKSSLINADELTISHTVVVSPATEVVEDGENVYVSTNSIGYYLIYNNTIIERAGLVNKDKNVVPFGTNYIVQPFN